jgi:Acetyltransferase (GNAT) domain
VAPRAELLADGGRAAAGPEFFRSVEFMAAEGVTHTLRIRVDGDELLAPLLVREVPGADLVDATSPYGYPGISGAPSTGGPQAVDPDGVEWSDTGLVSVFLRHALGKPPLAGATERGTVQVADPELPRKSRPSDRQQIRRNQRRGLEIQRLSGPDAGEDERSAFTRAYEQSMRRAGAAERYFFGAEYFRRILAHPRTSLFLAREPGGAVAAGSIAVTSDGFLHYYLSGTADDHLRDSPMKSIVSALVDFAEAERLPLNLGGGLEPGDRLEEFKRGFANREEPFRTHEIVCDRVAYDRLGAGADGGDFFPAYRAP